MVLTSHAQISAIFLQLIVGITDQKSTVTKNNRIKARWLQLYGTFFCPGGCEYMSTIYAVDDSHIRTEKQPKNT